MAKIKGIKKLNKAITAQVKPFGISKAFVSDTYAYYYDKNKISFKLTEGTAEDKWFLEFVEKRFDLKTDSFLLSILHEIGHSQTCDDINDKTYNFCMKEKDRICEEMTTANAKKSKKLEFQYFNLPDEILATKWAVDWIKTHPKKSKKLYKACIKALIDFYEKNEVE